MHQLANSKIGQLVNEMEQNSHFPFRNERRRNRNSKEGTIPIAGPAGLEINRSEQLPEKKKSKKLSSSCRQITFWTELGDRGEAQAL